MSVRALCLSFVVASACSQARGGAQDTDAPSTSSGVATASSSGLTGTPAGTSEGSSASSSEGSSSTSASASSSSSGLSSSSSGGRGAQPGCPDPLPAPWILCEDFEGEPGFGDFWTTDEAMAVEPGPATSGERSLRISHVEGQYGSGMADLRFGSGPSGGTVYDPEASHREVWVRFFLRTHEDWPAGQGISEGVEVMSIVGDNRSIAVDAAIYSADTAEARFLPWSCVHDSQLRCSDGNQDWFGNRDLRPLADVLGPSPLYGDERAGQWQCHEMHVRLDDPGQADGVLEFWADGNLEISLEDLEYVGSWDGAGLNNLRFGSFWNDQVGLDHHIDDVVVSTAPIGCPRGG